MFDLLVEMTNVNALQSGTRVFKNIPVSAGEMKSIIGLHLAIGVLNPCGFKG